MNLEAIDLYRQTQYLAKKITGAKISKIFMPTPTSLLLQLYKNEVLNLFCNLGGNGPALYLIDNTPANPANPPAFCMLLRKHFEDSKIAEICQINFDRIIKIRADVLEGNKIVTKDLIFELTGRTNNILFVQDGKIIDCLKHINGAVNRVRTILPNTEYILPPKKLGLHPLAIEAEKLTAAIYANPADNLTDKIMHTLIGIGKHTAEILAKNNDLTEAIKNLQKKYSAPATSEVNDLIQKKMAEKPPQIEEKILLERLVIKEIAKTCDRLAAFHKDLENADNAEAERIKADTLMANLYKIKKGDNQINLPSIYNNENLTIQLDPKLTPTENTEKYYKRYNKFKRAKIELKKQIEDAEKLKNYLESVDASLATSETKNEIAEINEELQTAGIIKLGKKKKQNTEASKPLHLHLENAEIYIGKNNKQNDFVTFKIAKANDLWFHVKNIPGSHVILQGEADEKNIYLAELLAAWFSKARNGSNIPVDMVQRKFVKKPNSSPPGFVIFTNNHTDYINIDEEEIKKILA